MTDQSVRTCVALIRPVYKYTEPESEDSLRALQVPPEIGLSHFKVVGQEIMRARNILSEMVLTEQRITHFLWIDSDATFAPDSLLRLLADDKDIVGGLAFSRHTPYHPIIGRRQPEWIERNSPFGWVYYYPPETVFECDATGAHFLLVKRTVIEAIQAKFGKEWWTRIGELSEDFSFMERAHQCGFKVHVDTGVKTGHIGTFIFTEDTAAKIRPFEWEPWLPDVTKATLLEGHPVASIVIPTYNQDPKWLRSAILSCAHQSVPVEVIVVDDGSTPPVVKERWPKNVRLITHPTNRGVAAALNTGIEAMTTPWFVWCSSDDMLMPRKVEVQLAALQQARMKWSYHRYQEVVGEEWARYTNIVLWRTIPEQMSYLARVCAINGSTVMIHKSVFDEVGRFDETLRYGQDYEMWCRIGEKHLCYPIEQILGSRREAKNLTAMIEKTPEEKALRDAEDVLIRGRYSKWI